MSKCICCQKDYPEDSHGILNNATKWFSYGNYGSTVLDIPFRDEPPAITILCDGCLASRKDCWDYNVRKRIATYVVLSKTGQVVQVFDNPNVAEDFITSNIDLDYVIQESFRELTEW